LLLFAKSSFALGELQEDKATLRHHLEVVWRRTGKKPQQLQEAPELPESVAHIWSWYVELSRKRQAAMSGVAPLLESEIGWFFANRGITPELWELDAINALDRSAIESYKTD